ncbi:MAG: hypothetical protein ACM3QW_00635, partial [Ignavibacteriales bacterium]
KATRVYYGEQHWSGGTVYVDGITFVDGDVHLNGSQISGTGSLIATGNIHIDGSGVQYATANDKVCIYAGQNLQINGSNVNIDGILYAPNIQVSLAGSHINVNGAVIGDTVNTSGSYLSIYHDQQAIEAVPVKVATLDE